MTATYTKLKSGDWGIRVDRKVDEGDVVEVVKKSGEKKRESVAKVIWKGNGIWLCAIGQRDTEMESLQAKCDRLNAKNGQITKCQECGKRRPLVYDHEDGGMKCYECVDIE